METSDAMDIEHNIFKTGSTQSIAESLKRSSTQSRRRKGTPFQSAVSMLNFYINRAGRNLPKASQYVATGQAQITRSVRTRALKRHRAHHRPDSVR
jgi:Protein of unknown function (DUF3175)